MNKNILFNQLEDILKEQERSTEEISAIKNAFEFAASMHEGQYRISEEPYIVHPLEVAVILANLKADKDTIIAALLHDILEDTNITPEELEKEFGTIVLNLVNGVTKLSKYSFSSKEERQAENFRKMFLAMAEDIRVIFLKLADRLHNMRTLNYMAPHKQKEIAKETIEIFAPIANRLGIGKIKAELEDLSLRYLNPEKYFEIAQLVSQRKTERDQVVQTTINKINQSLQSININATITGRAKHFYSIYNKMQKKNILYQDLYDITGIRVIVDTEKECYEVLGTIHSAFKPIPGRFKDYIAMPKSNLYRSLHTSVIGPRGKPIEVQIRTKEMNEVAEFGIAAHWKYKETGVSNATNETDQSFNWIRKLIEFQKETKDAKEYLNIVKLDLFSDQVFVFTPGGDVIDLPSGAVPIDFAYRVHTEVGHKCVGALVNGKMVPLDTKLKNGDIIEILTNKNAKPRLDWINIVATSHVKSKIKQWYKKNQKEDNLHNGRNLLEQELTKAKVEDYIKSGELLEVAKQLNYHNIEDLFAALGYGEITVKRVLNRFKTAEVPQEVKIAKTSKRKSKAVIEGLEGLLYHISKCCSPVPGEPIVGVVTRSRGVSVHREDCKFLKNTDVERIMEINWAASSTNKVYSTIIQIELFDRMGILKDILSQIADNKTNVTHTAVKARRKKIVVLEIGVEIMDVNHLNRIINSILTINDVISVKRANSGGEGKY